MTFDARRAFYWIFGLFIGSVLLVLIAAYSGVYNVAASRGHPGWMNWLLTVGLRRSVDVYSSFVKPHEINPDVMIPLGAGHFQGGCAPCHGAPGEPVNPVYQNMLPAPPPLQEEVGHWTQNQLYWIVLHGLQFAGMPAWSGQGRKDEVWSVVAFLKVLPKLTEQEYRKLAMGNVGVDEVSAPAFIEHGRPRLALTACARCHGTDSEPPTSALIPRLGGQPQQYLARALVEYKHNLRQSGFMEPVAAELELDQIYDLAHYYSQLTVPPHSRQQAPARELIERGRKIAHQGDVSKELPPCLSCHGQPGRSDIPRLAGQAQAYLTQQLELWRQGGRAETAHGRLMAHMAKRLSKDQIEAVTAYFAHAAVDDLSPEDRTSGDRAEEKLQR